MFTALVALSLFAKTSPEPVNLARQYKEGQTAIYKVGANVDQGGQQMSLDAVISLTVKKLLKDGAADLELNATKLTMSAGGSDQEAPSVQNFTGDANGMFKGSHFQQADAVFAILGICGYVPGKSVAIGESFPIDWKSDDFTAKGKGSISEVKTVDGKQVAVVKLSVEVTPNGDTPATVEVTSEVSVETGLLIRSEGTAKSDQFMAKIKVETAKPH